MARESGCRRGAVKKVDFIFVHLYTPPRRNNLPTLESFTTQHKDVCANNCFILLCEEKEFCFLLIVSFTFLKFILAVMRQCTAS